MTRFGSEPWPLPSIGTRDYSGFVPTESQPATGYPRSCRPAPTRNPLRNRAALRERTAIDQQWSFQPVGSPSGGIEHSAIDDAFHDLLGLKTDGFQDLYHFTLGGPVEDSRLQSHPPYAHLIR